MVKFINERFKIDLKDKNRDSISNEIRMNNSCGRFMLNAPLFEYHYYINLVFYLLKN